MEAQHDGRRSAAAAAGQLRPPPPPPSESPRRCAQLPLAGHPRLAFVQRYNLTFDKTDHLLDVMSVAFVAAGFLRFHPVLFPAAYVWLTFQQLVPIACIAWRRRSLAAHPADGGSWARWREVPCALVRFTVFGCGVTWHVMSAILREELAAQHPRADRSSLGLLVAVVNLVNISGAPWIVLLWFKPLRFGWALPLQLAVLLLHATPFTRQMCSHPQTIPPVLHPLLRYAGATLSGATLVLHPMLPVLPWSAGPVDDCQSALVFLQVAGFAGAAIFKARHEARLWQQHQLERAALGLPLEASWHGRVYGAVRALQKIPQPGTGWFICTCLLLMAWQAVMSTT